jgi:hypothetical protein
MKRNPSAPHHPLILDILLPLLSAGDYRDCSNSFLVRIRAVIAINMKH